MSIYLYGLGVRSVDNFHEEVIVKENKTVNKILRTLFFLGMIIFGLIALPGIAMILSLKFNVFSIITTVLFALAAYGCYVGKSKQAIEYEYTFTNGDIDIAQVIENSRRKQILSVDIKNFEIIAPITYEGYSSVENNPGFQKKYEVYLNKDKKIYYGVFNKGSGRYIILFEPSKQMLDLFKLYRPKNVIE